MLGLYIFKLNKLTLRFQQTFVAIFKFNCSYTIVCFVKVFVLRRFYWNFKASVNKKIIFCLISSMVTATKKCFTYMYANT